MVRHKARVIIIKRWKKLLTIYRNLQKINQSLKVNFADEDIIKVANTRVGWYRMCGRDVVNYVLIPEI